MVIKSKNILYSKLTKAAAVFLLWVSLAGVCVSAAYFIAYPSEFNSKDYRTTSSFLVEFRKYTRYAVDAAERLKNETGAIPGNTASGNTRRIFYGDRLAEVKNFAYIAIDRSTGTFVTNMEIGPDGDVEEGIKILRKQPFNISISGDKTELSYPSGLLYLNDFEVGFKDTSIQIYAAAMEPFKKGDAFYESLNTYTSLRERMPAFTAILALSLPVGILCFIYLIKVAGRRERKGQIRLWFVDGIYTDVQTALVIFAAYISLYVGVRVVGPPDIHIPIPTLLYYFALLSVDMFIGLTYILSITRHIKNRSVFRHTLLYVTGRSLMNFARRCINARTFKISVIVFLLAYGLFDSILFSLMIGRSRLTAYFIFGLWAAFNLAAVYALLRSLVSLSDIMKWVQGISAGNHTYSPDIKRLSPAFSSFAEDVRHLQSGLRNAVSEAVRGERLKTELITNVSHDLKTPLTSIINYVDLLKKEETENESIRQYTVILEEKSNRLKQLIDDLLEASKAASGNLAVSYESIDLYALLLQATAEFSEKAAAAGLDLRIRPLEKPLHIRADGKLMWRIMENLLSNVLKYSMKDSRVYIEVESSEPYGTITIKNISSQPLDIPADQLTERFVRGDRSRSEEGSGLGLAIAKGLAELQGGKLEIVIDGDLFKVCVSIPLESDI